MIIWSGWGILFPVLYIFSLIITESVINSLTNDPTYYATHGLPKIIGGLLGSLLVWLLVKWLEKKPKRVVIDKQTGKEFVLENKNSLFFIPANYWPIILVAISFILFFVK